MFIFVNCVFERIIPLSLILVGEQKNQIPCYFSSSWNLFGLGSAMLGFRQCRNSLELGIESVEPRTRVFFSWKLYFCTKGIIWYLKSLWKLSLKNFAKIFMSVGKFQCIKKKKIHLQQALPYGNVRFWPAIEIRNILRIQHSSDNDAMFFSCFQLQYAQITVQVKLNFIFPRWFIFLNFIFPS